jgi:hypothetical protein
MTENAPLVISGNTRDRPCVSEIPRDLHVLDGKWQIKVRSYVIKLNEDIEIPSGFNFGIACNLVMYQRHFEGRIVSSQAPLVQGLLVGANSHSFFFENNSPEWLNINSPSQAIDLAFVDLRTHFVSQVDFDFTVYLFLRRVC